MYRILASSGCGKCRFFFVLVLRCFFLGGEVLRIFGADPEDCLSLLAFFFWGEVFLPDEIPGLEGLEPCLLAAGGVDAGCDALCAGVLEDVTERSGERSDGIFFLVAKNQCMQIMDTLCNSSFRTKLAPGMCLYRHCRRLEMELG